MVVDTSALLAIALNERGNEDLYKIVRDSATRLISAVSRLEAGMVFRARFREKAASLIDDLCLELGLETVPFDETQARRAIAAFGRFGKGMGHKAQLNFGDCATYALASLRGEPVLAIGNDFAATDLTVLQP